MSAVFVIRFKLQTFIHTHISSHHHIAPPKNGYWLWNKPCHKKRTSPYSQYNFFVSVSTFFNMAQYFYSDFLEIISILTCDMKTFYFYMILQFLLLSNYFYALHNFYIWLVKIVFTIPIVLYCGRVPAANAHGCTAAEGLLYKPWSSVIPTCTASCLHQRP